MVNPTSAPASARTRTADRQRGLHASALTTLDTLGHLTDVLDDLGPIARRALRRTTT